MHHLTFIILYYDLTPTFALLNIEELYVLENPREARSEAPRPVICYSSACPSFAFKP